MKDSSIIQMTPGPVSYTHLDAKPVAVVARFRVRLADAHAGFRGDQNPGHGGLGDKFIQGLYFLNQRFLEWFVVRRVLLGVQLSLIHI